MTKTKPIKAWAIVNERGGVMNDFLLRPCIYLTRAEARQHASPWCGENVVRVEITVKRK